MATLRAGWATAAAPRLVFDNIVCEPKTRKKEAEFYVGNDITLDVLNRCVAHAPSEQGVVAHFETQERLLDHVFARLGLDTAGAVEHPVVMTEALANPAAARQGMSELLFEGYGVPAAAYGVDALFSHRFNAGPGAQGGAGA